MNWLQGRLTQVSKATFTSETLACINAVDHMIVLAILLHQLMEGSVSLDKAVHLTDGRRHSNDTGSKHRCNTRNFLAHLAWLQDKVKSGAISWLQWVDTREMYADGLTKGTVRRDRFCELAHGSFSRQHERKRLVMKYTETPTNVTPATHCVTDACVHARWSI